MFKHVGIHKRVKEVLWAPWILFSASCLGEFPLGARPEVARRLGKGSCSMHIAMQALGFARLLDF